MLADVEWHLSPATRMFTSDSFSPLLEEILLELPLKDVLRAALVSKHVNQVIADSAHIQLALRVILHQLPISETQPVGNHEWASYGATLRRLLEREQRLSTWTPKEIRCLHLPHSRVVDVQDGYILFEEHTSRERIFDDDTSDNQFYKMDGWTVWQLFDDGPTAQSDAGLQGKKHQGLLKWRGCLSREGGRVHFLAFCPKDNVIAVARRFGPVHSNRLNRKVFVNRFFFYSMRSGTSPPYTPEAHEEAALPFVEMLTEDMQGPQNRLSMISMQVIPGGRMLATICGGDMGMGSCTVWDWKNGICLGRMDPWEPCQTIFSGRFLTPNWVVCGTLHTVDAIREEETHYDIGFEGGEYGRLLCFDVFAIDHKPHKDSGPVGMGHESDVHSRPCSWTIWSVKPARRLCILYLLPIRQHLWEDDFHPEVFDIACPLTTCFGRHMPGVLTFGVLVRCLGGYLQAIQGVVPVRVILAAALCGSMRNFALDEAMHSNRSSSKAVHVAPDEKGGLCRISSTSGRGVETKTWGSEEGLDTPAKDLKPSMHMADDQAEKLEENLELSETRSSIHGSELSNYRSGPSAPPIMIPWSILRKYCNLSSDLQAHVPTSYGCRVLSVLVGDQTSRPAELINVMNINDYAPLALPATQLLRKGVAALHSKSCEAGVVGTLTRRCPLPKPFKLPQLCGEKSIRVVSDPQWVVGYQRGSVQCGIPYLQRNTSVSVDAARPVESAHFDGGRIILCSRNGANILSF